MQQRLFTDAGHGEGGALDALSSRDPDIARVIAAYGSPPDRSLPASFETLARAIIGQQVSRAAASSIHKRMLDAGMMSVKTVTRLTVEEMMQVGLSRRKAEYMIGIAEEIAKRQAYMKGTCQPAGRRCSGKACRHSGHRRRTADNFRLFRPRRHGRMASQ